MRWREEREKGLEGDAAVAAAMATAGRAVVFSGTTVAVGLLALIIPFFNFYLLFKGNELAWKSKQWSSVQDFQATPRKWMMAGLIQAR